MADNKSTQGAAIALAMPAAEAPVVLAASDVAVPLPPPTEEIQSDAIVVAPETTTVAGT